LQAALTAHPKVDQEAVHLHLEKLNKQQWWENVLAHHPKIDTTKIHPENSKLADLDGDTRCAALPFFTPTHPSPHVF